MEERKIASYYLKPVVRLDAVEPGTYVYDEDARLCYVDDEYHLHSYCIEIWKHKDAVVYPITLETTRIMEKMAKVRNLWFKSGVMTPNTSCELESFLFRLMTIDVHDKEYGKKEDVIWNEIKERYDYLIQRQELENL